jgi:hypothetical protein
VASSSFDTAGFYQAIDQVRQKRGVSWNRVMRETGVASCHVPSQMQARGLSPDSQARLAAWAGIDPSAFEQGK